MFRWLLILLTLAAAVFGLALGVLNADPVTLDLIAGSISLPLGGLVLLAFVTGLLAGVVLAWLLFIVPGRFIRRSRASSREEGGRLPANHRDG
ncbi:MAG: DUF1049 domain-containing protein [Gammaproteobacteria bacterium]|jgi:uncharacterized integral membrane protein|nr:DUF1049 domain-containing protein [Gammaproteobacteria bacterium]